MKKRFLLMMLAGVLAFSMIGCGGGDAEVEDPNTGDEIVDTEGDVEGETGDVVGGEEEQEQPEVQEPEQKPEVQDPAVDEEETTGDAEGDVEGEIVIDKAFADMSLEEIILASYANIEL
ncbi:MAG: hypothetical protein IKD13_02570, partial [Firmicutes bacterium]|nr:hypothetical protein [Bacillota bacterium]